MHKMKEISYSSRKFSCFALPVVGFRRWVVVGLVAAALLIIGWKQQYLILGLTSRIVAAPLTKTLNPAQKFLDRDVIPSRETLPAATPVMFDMSFANHPSVCNDSVPALGELQSAVKADGTVEIRHVVCCSGSAGLRGGPGSSTRAACRTAPKPLSVPLRHAEAALASGKRSIDLEKISASDMLAFVTGASTDHFTESLLLVRSLQKFHPKRRVFYWDLGLTAQEAAKIKRLCGVEYRLFNASKYPPHVATLKTYAFKPLVIMESFAESPILWWADASIRFTSPKVDHVLALMKQRHGIVMYRDPGHSVWTTTYPQTYEYMATDVEGLKDTVTATGASFLVANTKELFSTVLFWLYACMLDQRCIAPVMFPERCDMRGRDYFAKCHRFDQSVLTIIVANVWGFNSDGYRFPQDMFHVHRGEDGGLVGDSNVAECNP